MSCVWFVECSNKKSMLSNVISSNFPTKMIASLSSLKFHSYAFRSPPPAIVVVNLELDHKKEAEIRTFFKNHFPDAFIVVVLAGKKEQTLTFHPDKYFYSVSSFLSLDVVFQFIVKLSEQDQKRKQREQNHLKYRDIVYEKEKDSYRVIPDENYHVLPKQEARLLKYFLTFPKECLSRESIQKEVWFGKKVSSRVIDNQVSRLRKRLVEAEVVIESVYGGGYILR